jgi:hypothetical protein
MNLLFQVPLSSFAPGLPLNPILDSQAERQLWQAVIVMFKRTFNFGPAKNYADFAVGSPNVRLPHSSPARFLTTPVTPIQ